MRQLVNVVIKQTFSRSQALLPVVAWEHMSWATAITGVTLIRLGKRGIGVMPADRSLRRWVAMSQ